jgi:hypothetical protein
MALDWMILTESAVHGKTGTRSAWFLALPAPIAGKNSTQHRRIDIPAGTHAYHRAPPRLSGTRDGP